MTWPGFLGPDEDNLFAFRPFQYMHGETRWQFWILWRRTPTIFCIGPRIGSVGRLQWHWWGVRPDGLLEMPKGYEKYAKAMGIKSFGQDESET